MFLTREASLPSHPAAGRGRQHRAAAARCDDSRAHGAGADTAAAPRARLGFVYFPHGAVRQFWTPKKTGRDFDFSHILKPLEPLRDYVTVVSRPAQQGRGEQSGAPHGTTELSWLSCVGRPVARRARTASRWTRSPRGTSARARRCPRWNCAPKPAATARCRYRTPTQQLEMESNPRKVFYTLFGQGDNQEERREIVQHHRQPARLRARCHAVAEQGTSTPATASSSTTIWNPCARSSVACRSSRPRRQIPRAARCAAGRAG